MRGGNWRRGQKEKEQRGWGREKKGGGGGGAEVPPPPQRGENGSFFECFPYVCPEPVLVECSLYI
eukprot:COSAG06_NODE_1887_length_8141_cov_11.312609_7_plen_65_part_00